METPLEVARGLSDELGCTLLLKREDLQPVRRLRRALNPQPSHASSHEHHEFFSCQSLVLRQATQDASSVLTSGAMDPDKLDCLKRWQRRGSVACCVLHVRSLCWLQVFSFKLRGAYNKMASLTAEQLARGVICSSAGNHAQGVALAASHLVRFAGTWPTCPTVST